MKKLKQNKGITLIALVITIVVMLILAGVSISMLFGSNGIINRAKEAKEASEKQSIIENIKFDIATKETENLGSIDSSEIYAIIQKYGVISNDGTKLVTSDSKYEIMISEIYNQEKINMFKSNTVDISFRNNILSLNSNNMTRTNANIISWLSDSLEFERKANIDRQYEISILGDDEHFISIQLHAGQGINVYEIQNDIRSKIYTIVYYNQLPTYKGGSRFKISLRDKEKLKIELLQDKQWIDFYTIDIEEVKTKTNFNGDINLGVVVDKEAIDNGMKFAIYNGTTESKLYCKKISFLGDSITGNNLMPYSYYPAMVTTNVGAICDAKGYGGSSFSGGLNSIPSFVERFTNKNSSYYENVNSDSDIILVFGGNNGDKELGTINDSEGNTTYGALKIIIEYFENNYPNSKLIFATPIQGDKYDELKISRIEAIKEVCKLYNIPVIDLYNNSGITIQNSSIYLKDGVHPNDSGNRLIADYLSREILKINL